LKSLIDEGFIQESDMLFQAVFERNKGRSWVFLLAAAWQFASRETFQCIAPTAVYKKPGEIWRFRFDSDILANVNVVHERDLLGMPQKVVCIEKKVVTIQVKNQVCDR